MVQTQRSNAFKQEPNCRDQSNLSVTFDRMSGSIGSLLLVWSRIERCARDEVMRVSGSNPQNLHGVAAVLNAWEEMVAATQPAASLCPKLARALRVQLQKPIEIRNGICHGLIGISAAYDENPGTLSWSLNGSACSISWDDLQELLAWLAKVPRTLSLVSNQSLALAEGLATDTTENRKWWSQECGLELPEQ